MLEKHFIEITTTVSKQVNISFLATELIEDELQKLDNLHGRQIRTVSGLFLASVIFSSQLLEFLVFILKSKYVSYVIN